MVGHSTSAGGKHAERNDDAIVTRTGVIVKSGEVVFEESTEIGCKLG